MLTALAPAQYRLHMADEPPLPIPCPSASAGLYIRPRGSDTPVRATIPSDCLAFQTGEALELFSAGRVAATPHAVFGGPSGPAIAPLAVLLSPLAVLEAIAGRTSATTGRATRQTMAVFCQPRKDAVVDPATGERFGAFVERVLQRHYAADG